MKRTTFHALAGFAVMVLAAGGAYATPIAISPSPTLTVGALTFSDFSASITGEGNYSPDTATAIDVASLMTGMPGIEFTGDFDAFGSDSSGDVALDYTVTAAAGTTIGDIWLGLDGATLVGANANVTITECAFASLGSAAIKCISVYDPPSTLDAEISLGGDYSSLYITKDISYNAGTCSSSCTASLSIIDQRFSTVPEPGTLALFGGSLLGCALFVGRRRRSKTRA